MRALEKFPVTDTAESIERRKSFDLMFFRQTLIVPGLFLFCLSSIFGIYHVGLAKMMPILVIYLGYECFYIPITGYALHCAQTDDFDTKFWAKISSLSRIGAAIQNDLCFFLSIMIFPDGFIAIIGIGWAAVIFILSTTYYTNIYLAIAILSVQCILFYIGIGIRIVLDPSFDHVLGPIIGNLTPLLIFAAGFLIASNANKLYFSSIRHLREATKFRQRVEDESLKTERERNLFAATFDHISQGVLLLDENGFILRANRAAMSNLKITRAMIGQTNINKIVDLSDLTEEISEGVWEIGAGKYLIQSTILSFEHFPIHRVIIFIDVTRQLEEQDQIAQIQKLVAIGALSSGIAHDFNNVLAVIRTNSEILARELRLAPDHKNMLNEIQSLTMSGASLTRQLLSYARKRNYETEIVAGEAVIANVYQYAIRLFGSSYEIEKKVDANVYVHTDIQLLETALLNLIINARDAMPKGGKVELSIQSVDGFAKFSVVDHGSGISEDDLTEIRKPFVTKKNTGNNVGLGLAMVDDFAQRSRGKFEITSKLGEGTSASIWLKTVSEQVEHPQIAPVEARRSSRSVARILVIDDNESLARSMTKLLQLDGFDVQYVTSIAKLTALPELRSIDLVLCDVILKGESGLEAYDWFQIQGLSPRFIFISGNFPEDIYRHIETLPTATVLNKPVIRDRLLEMIERQLDLSLTDA